jgi:coenzyme F420 biosynthesis associated uncharacterized protein
MIDWGLADRIAGFVASQAPEPTAPALGDLEPLATECEALVVGYTGLVPPSPLPALETVGRAEWIEVNLSATRSLLDPVVERAGERMGPLAGPLQGAAGLLLAAEVGVLFGYVSQRVMGQYEPALLAVRGEPRLLLVGPNVVKLGEEMNAEHDDLRAWVTLHEVTHGVQFQGVPWLREHLAGLVRELIDSADVSFDPSGLLRMPSGDDLRSLVDRVREGDLLTLTVGEERRAMMDRIQALMAVIEGYAEHVMDVVGRERVDTLDHLRAELDRRRAERSPLGRLLQKLIGLDLKMRQYQLGKAFCDEIASRGGIQALNHVWSSPDAIPTLGELEDPSEWLERTRVLERPE